MKIKNYFWVLINEKMRRIALVLIISITIASFFVSCKSSERCPAYGSINAEQHDQTC